MNRLPQNHSDVMSDFRRQPDLADRTLRYAKSVIRLYTRLSRDTAAQVIGKQFLRSGTSVGANYREGFRARSRAEFFAKMGECLREIEETSYWLELVKAERMASDETLNPVARETEELIRIFVAITRRR